jgi:hypothetical protein
MPLAPIVLLGHGQDRATITSDGRFRHPKGARQPGSDAVAEALSCQESGYLLAAQAGFQAADAVVLTPPIRTLTHLGPTGIRTPAVWHLSYSFCVSVIPVCNS